jgi:hypothetical protein
VVLVAFRVSSSALFRSALPSAQGLPSGNPFVGLTMPLAREPFVLYRLLPMRGSCNDEWREWARDMGTSVLSMQAFGDVSAEG